VPGPSIKYGDLEMDSSSSPDPVPTAGSTHSTDLKNDGYDTFVKVGLIVGVMRPSASCGFVLAHDQDRGTLLPLIPVGDLHSTKSHQVDVSVEQSGAGAVGATVQATVEFAAEADDPQNPDPDPKHTASTEVPVSR
jgi:hypothetical protein